MKYDITIKDNYSSGFINEQVKGDMSIGKVVNDVLIKCNILEQNLHYVKKTCFCLPTRTPKLVLSILFFKRSSHNCKVKKIKRIIDTHTTVCNVMSRLYNPLVVASSLQLTITEINPTCCCAESQRTKQIILISIISALIIINGLIMLIPIFVGALSQFWYANIIYTTCTINSISRNSQGYYYVNASFWIDNEIYEGYSCVYNLSKFPKKKDELFNCDVTFYDHLILADADIVNIVKLLFVASISVMTTGLVLLLKLILPEKIMWCIQFMIGIVLFVVVELLGIFFIYYLSFSTQCTHPIIYVCIIYASGIVINFVLSVYFLSKVFMYLMNH